MNLKKAIKARSETWFNIAASKNESEPDSVYINGIVGQTFLGDGTSAKEFIKAVKCLKSSVLNVHINSPGGSVTDGISIYNYLNSSGKTVNVVIDGMAASIASVIAMAGDRISMAKNAMMMVHNPMTLTMGNPAKLKAATAELEKVQSSLIQIYSDRTGMKPEEVAALMNGADGADGTMMTADEALEKGFVTDVTENKQKIKAAALEGLCAFDLDPETIFAGELEQEPEPPCEPEKKPEEQNPEEKPEPKKDPEEKQEEPEPKPEEKPAPVPEKKPEESELEEMKAQLAAYKTTVNTLKKRLLSPGASVDTVAPVDFRAAVKACSGNYTEARKKYPQLFAKFERKGE